MAAIRLGAQKARMRRPDPDGDVGISSPREFSSEGRKGRPARSDDGPVGSGVGRELRLDRLRYLRRPQAPSRRCGRVQMERSTFLKFIACWAVGLALVLASALVVRLLG